MDIQFGKGNFCTKTYLTVNFTLIETQEIPIGFQITYGI